MVLLYHDRANFEKYRRKVIVLLTNLMDNPVLNDDPGLSDS